MVTPSGMTLPGYTEDAGDATYGGDSTSLFTPVHTPPASSGKWPDDDVIDFIIYNLMGCSKIPDKYGLPEKHHPVHLALYQNGIRNLI